MSAGNYIQEEPWEAAQTTMRALIRMNIKRGSLDGLAHCVRKTSPIDFYNLLMFDYCEETDADRIVQLFADAIVRLSHEEARASSEDAADDIPF